MEHDKHASHPGALTALVGIAPLYVFSTNLKAGLAMGWTLVLVYCAVSAMALLAPPAIGKAKIFALSMAASAVACSLSASFIRILDPFLFEAMMKKIFLVAFTTPVMKAAVAPSSIAERERAWDDVVMGLVLAATLVAFGTLRELLASGAVTLGGRSAGLGFLPMAAQPSGALILMALCLALIAYLRDSAGRRPR